MARRTVREFSDNRGKRVGLSELADKFGNPAVKAAAGSILLKVLIIPVRPVIGIKEVKDITEIFRGLVISVKIII